MKRPNPFLSPLGIVLTIVFFLGLAISLWRNQGLAFSPGPLTAKSLPGVVLEGYASHAEFEPRCGLCHEPLRVPMAQKCLDCHTGIRVQVDASQGLHGRIPDLTRCDTCHPDHLGRDFDPTQAAYASFDHAWADFSLARHQADYDATPMACTDCHTDPDYAIVQDATCAACHAAEDAQWMAAHSRDYGAACLVCHDGADRMMAFNHADTAFPLEGQHAVAACTGCHLGADQALTLVGISTTCEACHLQDKPEPHFTGACAACHTPASWLEVTFDHTGFTDCISCHAADAPEEHYPGQCSQCHNTQDWTQVTFDHTGFTDCLSCHAADAPEEHYPGQCSQCHNTQDWTQVTFDHIGFTDCLSCHAADAPEEHYPGQCSQCHNTQDWTQVTFDHTGFTDCLSCHAADAPEEHYPGQCSQCHNTNDWDDAEFNHTGFTDCISCHLPDRPDEHDPGQCSSCHNTVDWDDADDDDGGDDDNDDSILPGAACQACHPEAPLWRKVLAKTSGRWG